MKTKDTKAKDAKAKEVKPKKLWVSILIHGSIIIAILVLMAVSSHFLLRTSTRHGVHCTVPELQGVSLNEAMQIAKENNLKIHINDSLYVSEFPGGTVLDQLPKSGVEVKPGRTVYIVINAFAKRKVKVPYVAGRSLRQAKNMLDVAELEIKNIKYVPDMATNYVLSQSFGGQAVVSSTNLEATVGSGVELTVGVSKDDPYTRVPNVVGLSVREAKGRIWESGMNVGRINIDEGVNLLRDKNAKVYLQSSVSHSLIKWGETLEITVTMDQKKIDDATAKARKEDLIYEASM